MLLLCIVHMTSVCNTPLLSVVRVRGERGQAAMTVHTTGCGQVVAADGRCSALCICGSTMLGTAYAVRLISTRRM
jgi:hypothetical protein